MNENVRKIFDILGVEPNEKFKLESDATKTIYYITEDLKFIGITESGEYNFDDCFRLLLTNKIGNIVKLPKESKTKKLRDLTEKEFKKFCLKYNDICENCIFGYVDCDSNSRRCWIKNKDLYSDKFLDQEIEVEE